MRKTVRIWLGIAAALAVSAVLLAVACSGLSLPHRETESVITQSPGIAIQSPKPPKADVIPTAAPAEEVDPISAFMENMTPEEKVWQMLYVFPQQLGLEKNGCDMTQWQEVLRSYPVGGIVVNSDNIEDMGQLRRMLRYAKRACDITPFVGVDEEGGTVARIAYTLGETTDLQPMFTYRDEGADTARKNAETIGRDIAAIGFNQDFAPVADVWTNPRNTIIGSRAYSDDPVEAAELVSAAVSGFRSAGVIPTLKHFPGHGDTLEDSHYDSAHAGKTVRELRECEFLPFSAGINAGAGMVMVGHVILDKVSPNTPSTLSSAIVTGLLRDALGWDGVVITDSFAMAAICDNYAETEAAVLAIEAGCDIILGAVDPQAAASAILDSVSPERIDESVYRILKLKSDYGLLVLG